MEDNLYQILGLSNTATQEEIKKAYRRLAMQYHPDKNPSEDAEDMFMDIQEAYDTLSDPTLRAAYDQSLLYGTTYEAPSQYSVTDTYYEEPPIDPITGRRNYKYHRGRRTRKSGSAPKTKRIINLFEIPIFKAFYFTPKYCISIVASYVIVFFTVPYILVFLQMDFNEGDAYFLFPPVLFCLVLLIDCLLKGKYRVAEITSVQYCKQEDKNGTEYKYVVNYRISKSCNTAPNTGYLHQENAKMESIIYPGSYTFTVGDKYIFYYSYLLGYNYHIAKSETASTTFKLEERFIPLAICLAVIGGFGFYVHYHNFAHIPLSFMGNIAIFAVIFKSGDSS